MTRSGSTPIDTLDAPQAGGATQDTALDRRYRALVEHVGTRPGGHALLEVVVFVVGLVFVLAGIALAVLPGPLTIPPVLVGVYVWSLEFRWARRLRVRVTRSAEQARDHARQHPARATVITVGGIVLAVAVVWAVGHYGLVARAKGVVS